MFGMLLAHPQPEPVLLGDACRARERRGSQRRPLRITKGVESIEESPELRIVGGEPVRLIVVVPSELPVGEPFRVLVKAEDAWGNA